MAFAPSSLILASNFLPLNEALFVSRSSELNLIQFAKNIVGCCVLISLMGTVNANTCDEKTLNKYVDKIQYRPAKTMCGDQMYMLHIMLKQGSNESPNKINAISLDIRNANDISITRYPLKYSKSRDNTVVFSCINNTYVDNSLITFSVSHEQSRKTSNSNTLSLKTTNQTCNLKSVVKNT